MVAPADEYLCAWGNHAHCLQYVVPVEFGRARRVAVRPLDLRHDLLDLRSGSEPGERGMASLRAKRGRHCRARYVASAPLLSTISFLDSQSPVSTTRLTSAGL